MTIIIRNCKFEVKDPWCGALKCNVQREGGQTLRNSKEPNSHVVHAVQIKFGKNCLLS
jgi:hypothetical protein